MSQTNCWEVVPLVPLSAPSRQWFTYRAPAGSPLAPGMLVRIPFGPRTVEGLVWRQTARRTRARLKTIFELVGTRALFLPAELAALERLAAASLEPLAGVLKSAAGVRRVARSQSEVLRNILRNTLRKTKAGRRLGPQVRWEPSAEILAALFTAKTPGGTRRRPLGSHSAETPGVTRQKPLGSGTGQTLLLVPEIAMGESVMVELERRKLPAALFAQGLPIRARRAIVERLWAGEPLAVVATHAGVFLPFPRLERIVVIEAALKSHRQWDLHPRYDARVAAFLLARERGVPLTLQSSLPTLDLLALQQIEGKSKSARRKPVPAAYSLLPTAWRIIPRSPSDPLLLPESLKALREVLDAGGSALVFHDVVGAERVFACETCGHTLRCAQCQGVLERRAHTPRSELGGKRSDLQIGQLACRLCGTPAGPSPHFCLRCRSPHFGPRRVGTVSLARDLQRAFPQVPVLRLDRETLRRGSGISSLTPQAASLFLTSERALAVLATRTMGTVVVVSADRMLEDADLEATDHFLTVTARLAAAARAGAPLLLQTTHPTLPLVRGLASGGLSQALADELADRQTLGYPPYAAALRLEKTFPTAARAEAATTSVVKKLTTHDSRLTVGQRVAGLPPRVRAEILLRGPLAALQRATASLPASWSTDPLVSLSVLYGR